MMDGELVPETDPILSTICTDWDFSNPLYNPDELIECMTRIMHSEQGVGLSANQIGIDTRLFIMEFDDKVTPCFNPEIIQASEETVLGQEGCLSFPDLELKIKRPSWLSVSYQDISGNRVHEIVTGIKARCYSHELDHLNGIRFIDRASKLSVDMAKKRRAKNRRNNNSGR
jgi:peptide deformylase